MLDKLFRWLFRAPLLALSSQLSELKRREIDLDAQIGVATAAAGEITRTLLAAEALRQETEAERDKLVDLRGQALQVLTTINETALSQLSGFAARFDKLNADTSKSLSAITTEVASHVSDIKTNFNDLIDARAKAEVGKWVFVGGGGGTLAAVQYCTLCAQPAAKWRMVPDEGPVCEVCCETKFAVQ